MSDTKAKLLQAADRLLQSKGYYATSIADIAASAAVPRGNFASHFALKEDLGLAVANAWMQDLVHTLQAIDRQPRPADRVAASLRFFGNRAENIAQYGDPVLKIAHESAPESKHVAKACAAIYGHYLAWLEKQYIALGEYRNARDSAVGLASSLFGAVVLTRLLDDPQLLSARTEELESQLQKGTTRAR